MPNLVITFGSVVRPPLGGRRRVTSGQKWRERMPRINPEHSNTVWRDTEVMKGTSDVTSRVGHPGQARKQSQRPVISTELTHARLRPVSTRTGPTTSIFDTRIRMPPTKNPCRFHMNPARVRFRRLQQGRSGLLRPSLAQRRKYIDALTLQRVLCCGRIRKQY